MGHSAHSYYTYYRTYNMAMQQLPSFWHLWFSIAVPQNLLRTKTISFVQKILPYVLLLFWKTCWSYSVRKEVRWNEVVMCLNSLTLPFLHCFITFCSTHSYTSYFYEILPLVNDLCACTYECVNCACTYDDLFQQYGCINSIELRNR